MHYQYVLQSPLNVSSVDYKWHTDCLPFLNPTEQYSSLHCLRISLVTGCASYASHIPVTHQKNGSLARYRRVTSFPGLGEAPTHNHQRRQDNKQQAQLPRNTKNRLHTWRSKQYLDQAIPVKSSVHGHSVVYPIHFKLQDDHNTIFIVRIFSNKSNMNE
jgi:hypothetical protein